MRLADDMESVALQAKMQVVQTLREQGNDVNPDDVHAVHVGSFSPDNDPDRPEPGYVIHNLNGCSMRIVEVDWEWTPLMMAEYAEHGTMCGLKSDEDGFARRDDGLTRVCREHNDNPLVTWIAWCEKV